MCLYQDESIKIRKLAEDDLPSLHRLLSNEAVMRFLEALFTEVETQRFLQDAGLADPPLIYAVDNAAGDFVGYMIFHPYEGSFDELGWVLLPNFWGRGYAQRITGAAIQLAQKNGRNLLIECAPEQAVSRHIAKKFGFVYSGLAEGREIYRLCCASS